MPENVTKVPALLLLTQNYTVLYGDSILEHLKPKEEIVTKVATQNNMEPMAFSFGDGLGTMGGVVSDNYSFLDMDSESLAAKGNGGLRQMHSYVPLSGETTIETPKDDYNYKDNKIPEGLTVEQLQEQRNHELSALNSQQAKI